MSYADRGNRLLNAAAEHWKLLRIGAEVVERARRPFLGEPLRALDAIHLASALYARSVVAALQMLSLDNRIRGAARQLGMHVKPAKFNSAVAFTGGH